MTANIVKYEFIDNDRLDKLMNEDTSIVSEFHKKRLEQILKKKDCIKGRPNLLKVEYNYAKGFENLKIGRVYNSLSLGGLEYKIIRTPMCENHYWDIDMENCHFTIASQYAKKNGITCRALDDYVLNREEWLNKISSDRKQSKLLLLKIGYGGSIPDLYDESELTVNDEYNKEHYPFLQEVSRDMREIAIKIYNENPSWHTLKTPRKSRQMIKNRDNKEFVLLALFLQTEECKILFVMDEFFTQKGKIVDILIHDGLMIRKQDPNEILDKQLLKQCEEYIKLKTNYNIKLTEKILKMEWTFSQNQKTEQDIFENETYLNIKKEVEQKHFILSGKVYYHYFDLLGQLKVERIDDAQIHLKKYHWIVDDSKIYFYNVWIEDKKRREYETLGFYPNKDECPSNVFNTFHGFQYEKYNIDLDDLTKEEIEIYNSSKTKWQIEELFCNQDPKCIEYFYNYIANICFNPTKKANKCLILRNEIGGTGKSGFFEEFFIPKILGQDYASIRADADAFFARVDNDAISNKLLCIYEEGETRDSKTFTAKIKSSITQKVNAIRKLYCPTYQEMNYINWISATNKETPFIYESENMRRFPYIDCKEYRLTEEDKYLLQLETNDTEFAKIFIKILQKVFDNKFDFDNHPMSQTSKNMSVKYAKPLYHFLKFLVYDYEFEDDLRNGIHIFDEHKQKKTMIKLKTIQFYELYKSIMIRLNGKSFESLTQSQFIHDNELKKLRVNHPTCIEYKPSTKGGNTKYVLDLDEIKKIVDDKFEISNIELIEV